MLCAAAAVCVRAGQVPLRLVLLAMVLLALLALLAAGSFSLLHHPEAEAWRLAGLLPVAVTAAIAGREMLRGMFPSARPLG